MQIYQKKKNIKYMIINVDIKNEYNMMLLFFSLNKYCFFFGCQKLMNIIK